MILLIKRFDTKDNFDIFSIIRRNFHCKILLVKIMMKFMIIIDLKVQAFCLTDIFIKNLVITTKKYAKHIVSFFDIRK
jgi:hypothetical protein